MASRYRLDVERPINQTIPKPKSQENHRFSHELSSKHENTTNISNNVEFLQARLRSKAQIEHQLRQKLSDAYAKIASWQNRYQGQADRTNRLREELSSLRKRHTEEVDELNREIRWNHKKIKALERVIDENHQTRSPRTTELTESNKKIVEANEMLIRENLRLSEQVMLLSVQQEEHARQHEKLINELEQLKQVREGDLIDIQNLENAVKALHDENQILKETPIPVVLPQSQPRQKELGKNLFQYSSLRPTKICVSLIDQRAQERRRNSNRKCTPERTLQQNVAVRWPYPSSDEELI